MTAVWNLPDNVEFLARSEGAALKAASCRNSLEVLLIVFELVRQPLRRVGILQAVSRVLISLPGFLSILL